MTPVIYTMVVGFSLFGSFPMTIITIFTITIYNYFYYPAALHLNLLLNQVEYETVKQQNLTAGYHLKNLHLQLVGSDHQNQLHGFHGLPRNIDLLITLFT